MIMLFPHTNVNFMEEKVSCETTELPSVMWKRPIVQAMMECARAAATLALVLTFVGCLWRGGAAADLVIEIPGSGAEGGRYRLDYRPPVGAPPPNHTVPARASTINFQGLPGTKYHFMLYYSNATFADLLTWNQTIVTAPDPPTNLTVTLGRNKQATIAWSPPALGEYTGFRFRVIPLTERGEAAPRNFSVEAAPPAADLAYSLRDLSPGATYQLHAFTLLHDKESVAYASRNFTTRPNTPGKFIVWFRNETTLLVLWQPPYPPGAYTHYKVSIVPPDALESEQYVEKEGEPPGPAQAAFKGLVPGRPYNISVQTVSEPEISAPTTAQYRTVPLRPRNLTVPPDLLSETAFTVRWLPPAGESEFERYQVSVSGGGGAGGAGGAARRLAPLLRARTDPPLAHFDALDPGAHYTVTVKTMSGKVTSWPATADVTLKPLPVVGLQWARAPPADAVAVRWAPAPASTQDEYRVSYHEAGPTRDDSNTLTTAATNLTLETLLPGRNYTVTVCAVSRGVESNESSFSVATRPLAPVVVAAAPAQRALALAWRSDVNSRQELFEVRYRRRDAPAPAAASTLTVRTRDTDLTLRELFPGAAYSVELVALSHGLVSEAAQVTRAVRPLPPAELRVWRATTNAAAVRWRPPDQPSALGEFLLQYRTVHDHAFTALPPLPPTATHAEITNMTHGERYEIQLESGSELVDGESVPSGSPLLAYHTLRPNPVSNVAQLADTRNVTLEWPRPGGRVEWYSVRWWPADGPEAAAAARNLSGAGDARVLRVVLDDLRPGAPYRLAIAAHSYNLTSDIFTMDTRTRPLILSEMTIGTESDDSDNENDTLSATLRVVFTRTPAAATRFDAYRFRLEGEREGEGEGDGEGEREQPRTLELPAEAASQQVEFRALVPGRLYNVTMWTVSGNVTSHPVQRQARLYPRPIPYLNATAVGAREVALQWGAPAGDYSDFEVQYLAGADALRTQHTRALRLSVAGLAPHTNYTFTVVVRAGARHSLLALSRAVSAHAATHEAPPAPPADVRVVRARPAELTLAWRLPPADAHGALRRFVLQYAPTRAPDDLTTLYFPPDAEGGVVRGVRPGGEYAAALWAENGAGAGGAARLTLTAPIGAPPPPAPEVAPADVRRTPTTLVVRFRSDYFSAANGNVTAYTLVLSETPANETPARLPSWRDVHALPVWPPYQVTEPYYPFRASPVEEFTIGSERCEGGGRAYCNGPLKPATKYYVKLRAFTAPDKFTDTAYTVMYTGGQHGVGGRVVRRRGAGGAGGGRAGGAAPPARARRAAAARAAQALAPRARRRLHRPLPPHVRRLRLQVQRGVRGAEGGGPRAAVHGGGPAVQPAQEPVHEHPAVRPLALQAAAGGRRGGLRLHKRQLRAGAQLAARVHRHAGPAALHARRLLAHVLGVGLARHRHAHALRGEGPREVRPLLAVRHAARLLRRHRRHRAQREPLPRLDHHRAAAEPRRRAARADALPLHHVARLRRAVAAHHAGAVRARLPRPLPRGRAARGGALQRRRRPLRHLHHARPRAAAAGGARRPPRHLRHGARHAPRARLDGADGAAVHLHPPVHRGRARGAGPERAPRAPRAPHPAQPQPPPQRRLRSVAAAVRRAAGRRRGHRGVGHVARRSRRPPLPERAARLT